MGARAAFDWMVVVEAVRLRSMRAREDAHVHDQRVAGPRQEDRSSSTGSSSSARVVRPPRIRLFGPPSRAGAAGGLVFAAVSFSPTQMPRTAVAQGAITGVSTAIGYSIGVLTAAVAIGVVGAVGTAGRTARRRHVADRELDRWTWQLLALGAVAVVTLGAIAWPRWQDEQRTLLAMDPVPAWWPAPMLFVAAVVLILLGLLGRLLGAGVVRLHRLSRRRLPGGVATLATAAIVIALSVFVLRDVLGSWFVDRAQTAFGTVDTSTSDGTVQPTSPLVSGSPDSLAPWDTLGRQGRDFVAEATDVELMREFHGADATVVEPIRVYAGLRSADSAEERAALALAELERTGAFERSVLVVTTVTGTGWVDPDAARAVEVLHGGDTAIVAIQYSYLPSWISTLVDVDRSTEAGRVLFETVHAAWRERPADDRPDLVVFGQSLGSYGAEAAFLGADAAASIASMVERTDGALLTGPTNDNAVWRQLVAARRPDSPVWRPRLDGAIAGGEAVRFFTDAEQVVELDPDWATPRVVYVQHASDPVTFWSMDSLWRAPEWMDEPRGPDVPTRGGWFPVVTWVQGLSDLMAGFGAPPGHGHDYRLAFAGAWSQIVPPEGWTSEDARRLAAFLVDP